MALGEDNVLWDQDHQVNWPVNKQYCEFSPGIYTVQQQDTSSCGLLCILFVHQFMNTAGAALVVAQSMCSKDKSIRDKTIKDFRQYLMQMLFVHLKPTSE